MHNSIISKSVRYKTEIHSLVLEHLNFLSKCWFAPHISLSLNGKLSVRDNQFFMNWYGKPVSSLLRSESISVLHVTLL